MPSASVSRRRLRGLDGLRGLAAVGVVVLHVWMYTGGNDPTQSALLDAVIGELRLGLVYFFVLSGFLLALPWVDAALGNGRAPRLGRFVARRLARIGPAYWLALAAAAALLAGTGHPRAASLWDLPIFALFAQNLFEHTRGLVDPPMWSLHVEVGFYLALPSIGWGLIRAARRRRRLGPLALCAGLVVIGLAWSVAGLIGGWPLTAMTSLPTYLPLFACGIAAAVLAHGRALGIGASVTLLAGGGTLVGANAVWHAGGTDAVGHVVRDLPAAVGFAAIIVAIALRPPGVLAWAPIVGLGTISYGVYLWHMPVLYWLRLRGELGVEPLGAMARVLAPTLVLGVLSWVLVERRAIRRPSRRRERGRHRVAAPAGAS